MSHYRCSRCDATWDMLTGKCVYCPMCQNKAVPMQNLGPVREERYVAVEDEDEDEGIIGDIAAGAVAGVVGMAVAGMLLDDDDPDICLDDHEDFEGGGGESGGGGSTDEW